MICRRCKEDTKIEEHHTAPKYIFGKVLADEYPGVNLCTPCHRLWHKILEEYIRLRVKDGAERHGALANRHKWNESLPQEPHERHN